MAQRDELLRLRLWGSDDTNQWLPWDQPVLPAASIAPVKRVSEPNHKNKAQFLGQDESAGVLRPNRGEFRRGEVTSMWHLQKIIENAAAVCEAQKILENEMNKNCDKVLEVEAKKADAKT